LETLKVEWNFPICLNFYVEERFYSLKSTVTGGERFIVKLLLNSLYGYFGRKSDGLVVTYPKRDTTPVTRGVLIDKFGITNDYDFMLTSERRFVPSNVAIASAITAYSRIVINPFKIDPNTKFLYGDTDSAFLEKPLDPKYVGPGLGQFKDELNGGTIKEAIFMGEKTYAFLLEDGSYKVVVAGFQCFNL
jgi:DNA polymerase elongation subunit (family B)